MFLASAEVNRAMAAVDGRFTWLPFLAALAGGVLLHSGTNIVNEIYDVRQGIDTIASPRAAFSASVVFVVPNGSTHTDGM